MSDLWEELLRVSAAQPILIYGMGNGAEKLLRVCESKGVKISGVFCSDGFERNKIFHGFPVVSYSSAKKAFGRFTALLAFGSAREEVLDLVRRIADEQDLFVPDLPVAGDLLFDEAFFETHKNDFDRARSLFSDELSETVFDAVISAKLHGRLDAFEKGLTTLDGDFDTVLHPEAYVYAADLGAYDGDSVFFLLKKSPGIERVTAFEPDVKTFAHLKKKTEGLPVRALNFAAWDREEELPFTQSGNRGAGICAEEKKKTTVRGIPGDDVFAVERLDFIKFDVEGAEKRALKGLEKTIAREKPEMLISCYHRPEDLFDLPLYISEHFPFYRLFLRRQRGVPAWDVNLFCTTN